MMDIVNATTEYFTLDQMIEPQPAKEYMKHPDGVDWYKRWFDRLMTNPWFLIIKARK